MFKLIDTINRRTYEVEEVETIREIVKDLKREYEKTYDIKTKAVYRGKNLYELVEEAK